MSKDKPKLSLVTQEEEKKSLPDIIEDIDITNLDVDKLREVMLKNVYVVEAALFQQAGYEYKRVNNIRGLVSDLERELFDPAVLAAMSPDQKIKLYNNLTSNMGKSLEFLSHLHANVTSGIDTLNKIEKLKTETNVKKTVELPGGGAALEEIKKLILDKIKEKVNK